MNEYAENLKKTISLDGDKIGYISLEEFESRGGSTPGGTTVSRLPYSAKVLLESVLRQIDGRSVTEEHVESILSFTSGGGDVAFKPARVIMQDFTGVPGIVDLAAMRDSLADLGGDPKRINPLIPVDLVIDHSVQVDQFGSQYALMHNAEREFERNRERYEFLHWAANSFDNFSVVPPATGIVHQVNLEYLARVVQRDKDGSMAYPDTVVGTDSHTTMINGIGVLGWGVGGIEAEAALLGQPIYIRMPEVVGVRLFGELPEAVTATDLVLRVTEQLRELGVVGKFVEFYGEGVDQLTLPDRATISNMCPEYGATAAFFPVDSTTISFLRMTGRDESLVRLVETYAKAQGLFRVPGASTPEWSNSVELDLGSIEPSVAGPKRPQDRQSLSEAGKQFAAFADSFRDGGPKRKASFSKNGTHEISDGAVVIAAITSCTNTSNPSVMVAAGLVAKRAAELGMTVPAHVKTSLAPGSRVVTRYLDRADLTQYLDALGFNLVGYGCTTCIGNSGPLDAEVSTAVQDADLLAVAVLSGNRNFEGRVHPEVQANYLASPPLVVAYALAGRFDIDLETESIGADAKGNEVYLKDIWPSPEEVAELVAAGVGPDLFTEEYGNVYSGNESWNDVKSVTGDMYQWDDDSTYIKRPPFFEGLSIDATEPKPIENASVLAMLGDSVTTDHISPAGMISQKGPAATWLSDRGVEPSEFNSFGSRRGNHEVMMRGTFANIRIRNKLVPGVEGGFTKFLPTGEELSIYDAAEKYREASIPLIVLAGKDYGMGSSRDWAAKGVGLLGVHAAIAESYERIHRSNLIGMGVLPLQFADGDSAESLGLTGEESFSIPLVRGVAEKIEVAAKKSDGTETRFICTARIDTDVDFEYFQNGGILHTVLRQMAK